VWQSCVPEAALNDHPMGRFAGEWLFDLRREGRERHYLGADVVGLGLGWGDATITGSGKWTRFGHSFVSFGVLVHPSRQITGGIFNPTDIHRLTFAPVPETAALIIGVAAPEEQDDDEYPTLTGAEYAGDIAETWRGRWEIYDENGNCVSERAAERHYGDHGWDEDGEAHELAAYQRFGRALLRVHGTENRLSESLEICDGAGETVIALRRELAEQNGAWREIQVQVGVFIPVK
jgi:hypothetical protein